MTNASNEFKQLLADDKRDFLSYVDVTLADGTILNLVDAELWDGGLRIEDAVSSDNSFDIGSAIINKCTLTLNNIYDDFSEYDFEGTEIVAYVGLRLADGNIEKLRKGTFAVDEAKYNSSLITLSCLDNMRLFDRPYSESKLTYPATLNAIVLDACTVCGVTLNTVTFPHDDFIIQERPTDEATTFREVISWCAQIAGRFCRCDVYGRLELKWYNQAALENPKENKDAIHQIKSTFSTDVSMDDVVITGVRVVEKNESEDAQEILITYQSGTDGYVISIENNDLIRNGSGQTVAGWLGEQLIGFRFRKASVTHIGDPTIEAGDVAILTDRKGVDYKLVVSSTKFSPGNTQSTNSSAETPARNSATRYSAATKNYVEWRNAIQKEKTAREQALSQLADRLAKTSGAYTTVETVEGDGSIFYLHNKPVLAESDMIWKMTAEAWGVSTDGGETWNAGMTVDGDTIVRILTATGVNCDWLNTGAITIKDSAGKIIFSVDMDSKQVIISGDSVRISGKTVTTAINDVLAESKDYSDGKLADYANTVSNDLAILQAQVDGQVEDWYYDYEPSIQNYPASEWVTSEERTKHIGDRFFWKSKGYAYRFMEDDGAWGWVLLQDTDITKAMQMATKAQDIADGKRRTFVVTPKPPYDIGDMWTNGTDILTCAVARTEGSAYVSSDWQKLNTYTDDTVANEALEEARKSRNLNIILDNEYQGIPADYQGNITSFPTVKTFVQVLYGHTDVSVDCSYSVAKSAGVTGTWDGTMRTYTVTGLTTDTGWVDITASYLSLFTTTKRFNVAKVKGGLPGEQGTQGINLALKTADPFSITGTNSTNQAAVVYKINDYKLILSKTITISFDYLFSDGATATKIAIGQSATPWKRPIILYTSNVSGRIVYTWKEFTSNYASDAISIRCDGFVGTLTISNFKLELGTVGSPVWTPAIEDLQGADGRGIKSTAVSYQASTSGTDIPTGTWVSSPPNVSANQYLWTRTIITYTDNTTSTSYSIGKMGANGTNGTNGKDGVGISSVSEHYAVSTSNSAAPTTWKTTVPTMTATNKYLWNYETITYTNGTTADTAKRVIGVYGDKGATGAAGATGKGIKSVTNYYLATASASGVTTSASGWTTTVQSVSASKKYLWNYETITYTDNTTSSTAPCIIGAYGDKGANGTNGTNGKDGVGVKSTAITYQASSSGTTTPTGTWSSSVPSTSAGQYLWTRTVITYTNNSTSTSYSVSRNGSNGAAGRTYFMEPSTLVVKRSQDNSMAPNYITLSAYYRDGTTTARTAYAGRFKIEESLDGANWTTVYTSSANESTVTHSLLSALATSAGGAISTASNKTIGIPRDVVALRCTLYAAGGTTRMLDMQSIAVVVDVDALTHEEIFNLLTNNGVVKGIYQEGNQLYISFTYAKGGQLTLGGSSNGNGRLVILDSTGKQVGYIDNTGVSFEKGVIKGSAIYVGGENNNDGRIYIIGADGKEFGFIQSDGLYLNNYVSLAKSLIYDSGQLAVNSSDGNLISFNGDIYLYSPDDSYLYGSYVQINKYNNCGRITLGDVSEKTEYGFPKTYFVAGKSGVSIYTNMYCSGTKSRVAGTENYGEKLLYCYEMPSPMFGDIGEAQTDENGECYIYLDDIFSETVTAKIEYQVFLQKEGPGDIWIAEKNPIYFVVRGTENLKFAWEIKAKQRDYEYERLENFEPDAEETQEIDYEAEYLREIKQVITEQEEALYATA